MDRRAHLDGLRCLAVYLVVAFHSEVHLFPGGFIGVDVFFVLSGYLVTNLLTGDIDRRGRIDLRRFYARRYRRLLPAAYVALAGTAMAFVAVATASEVADATAAFRAAYLYVANWYFIAQSTDYFAPDIERSPVIHFWSLAVEEQFYLIWPLLLGGLFALRRRFRSASVAPVRAAVALGLLASMVVALRAGADDLPRAYYGTDTRAYQLLAGALLALTPALFDRGRGRRDLAAAAGVAAALGLVAIVVIGTTAIDVDPIERGVLTTAAAVIVILGIERAPSGRAAAALSGQVVSYLGRLSYGTYLWHWPVIVVLDRELELGGWQTLAITSAAATALAAVSYHAFEVRVRTSAALDRHHGQVIAAGLGLSVLGALVVAPIILGADRGSELVVDDVGGTGVRIDWEAAKDDIPPLPDCSTDSLGTCTLVEGSGPHILLLGDSNARMYIPTFEAIARERGFMLSAAVGPLCPWQLEVYYLRGGAACRPRHADWYGGLVEQLDPDVIVLANRPMDDPASPVSLYVGDGRFDPGDAAYDEALRRATEDALAELTTTERAVVLLEPIPIARKEDDPLACLSSATDVGECAYEANGTATPIERYYREAVTPGRIASIDLDHLVCPRLPTCDAVVDGVIVKRDHNHLTGAYAARMAPGVEALLEAAGVLDR